MSALAATSPEINASTTVITYVNVAHFIDHDAILIFTAAIVVMGSAINMTFSDLLPGATPGFVAFGAGSLVTGWLGDRWSRRHMLAPFLCFAPTLSNAA